MVAPLTPVVGLTRAEVVADFADASGVELTEPPTTRVPEAPPTRGLSTTPPPKLLADWKDATVKASIFEAAYATFADEVEAAVLAEQAELGRKLTQPERGAITKRFVDAKMPTLEPVFTKQLAATPALREQTVVDAVKTCRPEVAKRKDPFTPIVRRDPGVRAKEVVLWENANVLVIVDSFATVPQALVIPKTSLMFPSDASASVLTELSRVAAATGDAMIQAANASRPAECWVNPPHYLQVRQLHVHVDAGLPPWSKVAPTPAEERRLAVLYFADVTRALATRLGPSS